MAINKKGVAPANSGAPSAPATITLESFIVESNQSGGLLQPGLHDVTLDSMELVTPKAEGFIDPTPQVKCVFKNEEGKQSTAYLNSRGYVPFEDLSDADKKSGRFLMRNGYAIDQSTGLRIHSEEKTAICKKMMGNLAYACGVEKGEKINLTDLTGSTLVIKVELNTKNQTEVTAFLREGANVPSAQSAW